MNYSFLSLSVHNVFSKSPLFTLKGHSFVLAGVDMYKSFASVVFADFQKMVVKKSKFGIFRATPLELVSTNGNYSNLRNGNFINETSSSLSISDCFFMKLTPDSDQSPSAVYYSAPGGEMTMTYTTFLACTSIGEYGTIYAECERAFLGECCFRECYSHGARGIILQGQFAMFMQINESMITAQNHQVNQSSTLFAPQSEAYDLAHLLNVTGIQTDGTAIFDSGNKLVLRYSTYRNITSGTDLIYANNSILAEEVEFSIITAETNLAVARYGELHTCFFINVQCPSTLNGEFYVFNCTSDKNIIINGTYSVEDYSTEELDEFFLYGMARQQCLGYEVRDDCYNTTWGMVKFSVAVSTYIYFGLVGGATILFFAVKNRLRQPVDDTVVVEYQSGSEWEDEGDGIKEILAEVDQSDDKEDPDEHKPTAPTKEPTKETPLLAENN